MLSSGLSKIAVKLEHFYTLISRLSLFLFPAFGKIICSISTRALIELEGNPTLLNKGGKNLNF